MTLPVRDGGLLRVPRRDGRRCCTRPARAWPLLTLSAVLELVRENTELLADTTDAERDGLRAINNSWAVGKRTEGRREREDSRTSTCGPEAYTSVSI